MIGSPAINQGENRRLIESINFEPSTPMPSGTVISANSDKAALETYGKVGVEGEGGIYQGGEIFVVLGGIEELDWQQIKGATSSYSKGQYFPVIQVNPEMDAYVGDVQYVRFEDNAANRKSIPRFRLVVAQMTSKSVSEVRGYYNLGNAVS